MIVRRIPPHLWLADLPSAPPERTPGAALAQIVVANFSRAEVLQTETCTAWQQL